MSLTKHSAGSYRVYLSINKQTPPEFINRTLEYLVAFENLSVYTYDNSTSYDKKDLDKMNAIFLLTPNCGESIDEYSVGKGQFTELEFFHHNNQNGLNNAFVVSDLNFGLGVDEIQTYEVKGLNDWTNWGIIYTNGAEIALENYSFFKPNDEYYKIQENQNQYKDQKQSSNVNLLLHLALTKHFI